MSERCRVDVVFAMAVVSCLGISVGERNGLLGDAVAGAGAGVVGSYGLSRAYAVWSMGSVGAGGGKIVLGQSVTGWRPGSSLGA